MSASATPQLSFRAGKAAVYAIMRDMYDQDRYELLRHLGEAWMRHINDSAEDPRPMGQRHLTLVR